MLHICVVCRSLFRRLGKHGHATKTRFKLFYHFNNYYRSSKAQPTKSGAKTEKSEVEEKAGGDEKIRQDFFGYEKIRH